MIYSEVRIKNMKGSIPKFHPSIQTLSKYSSFAARSALEFVAWHTSSYYMQQNQAASIIRLRPAVKQGYVGSSSPWFDTAINDVYLITELVNIMTERTVSPTTGLMSSSH